MSDEKKIPEIPDETLKKVTGGVVLRTNEHRAPKINTGSNSADSDRNGAWIIKNEK